MENDFGGDLRAALPGLVRKARRVLKSFHGIEGRRTSPGYSGFR